MGFCAYGNENPGAVIWGREEFLGQLRSY